MQIYMLKFKKLLQKVFRKLNPDMNQKIKTNIKFL